MAAKILKVKNILSPSLSITIYLLLLIVIYIRLYKNYWSFYFCTCYCFNIFIIYLFVDIQIIQSTTHNYCTLIPHFICTSVNNYWLIENTVLSLSRPIGHIDNTDNVKYML